MPKVNLNLPWTVEYCARYQTWDRRSSPRIVDSKGDVVIYPPQNVGHPGQYDERADILCQEIVRAVNKSQNQ